MNRPFSFTGRVRSFRAAFAGIWTMLKSQQNAWIHAFASIVVIAAGFIFSIAPGEWCWLVLAMVSVWMAEALNTAFEFLADVASPEFHPLVKKAKDIAAGAVLITALGAVIIGIIVLGPYLLELIA
jgi:diacylglycerol kinase (ATP)